MTLPLKSTRSGAGGRGRSGRCAANAADASSALRTIRVTPQSIAALRPSIRPSNFDARVPRVRPFEELRRYSDPLGSSPSPSGVDDIAARFVVTPLVGVAVPNLAGMVNHASHST